METSHKELLSLYEKVLKVSGIKNAYIGSGIRYDLFLDKDGYLDDTSKPYLEQLVTKHTSGRLKVAPEHTCDHVLRVMGKPSFKLFERLRREFDDICRRKGLKYQLVPYFISGHRMQDGGYGKPFTQFAPEKSFHGTSSGFYSYSYDTFFGNVLYRIDLKQRNLSSLSAIQGENRDKNHFFKK